MCHWQPWLPQCSGFNGCSTNWVSTLPRGTIFEDNQPARAVAENNAGNKIKHTDTKIHFLRDYIEKGFINIKYIPTNEQLANGLINI